VKLQTDKANDTISMLLNQVNNLKKEVKRLRYQSFFTHKSVGVAKAPEGSFIHEY